MKVEEITLKEKKLKFVLGFERQQRRQGMQSGK